jgi:adenylate cyclase class 2
MTELSYLDFTLKAKVSNIEKMEEVLSALNATYIGLDRQRDVYFNVPKGRLKWRQGTIENLITHYERVDDGGLEKTIVYRYDLDPTPDQITALRNSYREMGSTEKERKIFYLGNVKIHLDTTLDNQNFIEIEAIDRTGSQSAGQLRIQCLSVKRKLEIEDIDLIKTGYF